MTTIVLQIVLFDKELFVCGKTKLIWQSEEYVHTLLLHSHHRSLQPNITSLIVGLGAYKIWEKVISNIQYIICSKLPRCIKLKVFIIYNLSF
jgi:hypothetical protein